MFLVGGIFEIFCLKSVSAIGEMFERSTARQTVKGLNKPLPLPECTMRDSVLVGDRNCAC